MVCSVTNKEKNCKRTTWFQEKKAIAKITAVQMQQCVNKRFKQTAQSVGP